MPKVEIHDSKIRAKLTALGKLAEGGDALKTIVGDMGSTARDLIRARTAAGKSIDGDVFAPYSKGYLKKRKDRGLGSTPNLSFTGKMMTALRWRREGKSGIRLGFENATDRTKAEYNHYGTGHAKARPFFGLNDQDRKSIVKVINARIREILGKS